MPRDIEGIEVGALQHGIENGGALPAGFGAKEQEVLAGLTALALSDLDHRRCKTPRAVFTSPQAAGAFGGGFLASAPIGKI